MSIVLIRAIVLLLLAVLVLPTVLLLQASHSENRRQIGQYQDDGYRYVLDTGIHSSREAWARKLGGADRSWRHSRLMLHAATASSQASVDTKLGDWLSSLRRFGLFGRLIRGVPALPDSQPGPAAMQFRILMVDGTIRPVLVLEADDTFVKAYELDVGTVLYRRRYFDRDFSGYAVEITGSAPPGPTPR